MGVDLKTWFLRDESSTDCLLNCIYLVLVISLGLMLWWDDLNWKAPAWDP